MPIMSYEVGASFSIQDEASGPLMRMSEAATGLAERAEAVTSAFENLGRVSFARMTRQLGELGATAEKSIPGVVRSVGVLTAALADANAAAVRLSDTMLSLRGGRGGLGGGGGGGRGGGGGGGDGEGAFSPRDGWNEAAREAYPNARYWDHDYNQVERRMRGAADYENRDNDLIYRNQRALAEREEADRQAAYMNMRRGADYENADEDARYRNQRSLAERENADEDARYRSSRGLAERENRDFDIRRQAEEREQAAINRMGSFETRDGWNSASREAYANAQYDNANYDRINKPPPDRGGGIGSHGIFSGMAPLIEAVGVYGSYKGALSTQQSLMLGAQAFNADPGSDQGKEIMEILRRAAADAAIGTSFSQQQTAAGVPLLARPFALEGVQGAQDFSKVYAGAARSAEAVDLMRLGSFDDTLQAAIEYAHETRTYDPQKFQHQMDVLGAITTLVPHTTFGAEARTMSYIVPMARTAGIDPEEAATATGFLQQGGLRGTVAATTLRQMLVGLTRTGGPMNAHMTSMSRQLSRGLHLQPEVDSHLRGGAGSAHVRALHDVGYLDAAGKPTFLNAQGGFDLEKAIDIFSKYAATHTAYENETEAYDLFGVRGQQSVELISAAKENYQAFRDRVHRMTDDPDHPFLQTKRDELSQGGLQEFEQAWGRIKDISSNLAYATLPGFQGALEKGVLPVLNRFFQWTQPDAEGHFSIGQQAAGYGAEGAAAVGSTLGIRWLLRSIFGRGAQRVVPQILGGGEAAAAGEGAAAAVTTLSVGTLALGVGGAAALGAAIYGAWRGAVSTGTDIAKHGEQNQVPIGFNEFGQALGYRPATDAELAMAHRNLPPSSPAGGARAAAGLQGYIPPPPPIATTSEQIRLRQYQEQHGQTPIQISGVTVNVPPGTPNVDSIKALVEKLLGDFAHKLSEAMTHSSGTGDGSFMSPAIGGGIL
ncbi:MAG TPA: phage tail tape measure protein [Acetobacteraceae bacterium]|jgi:hypothetical protein|nr:phage tail tape measure protein [Acetobacteraceae bacterium]